MMPQQGFSMPMMPGMGFSGYGNAGLPWETNAEGMQPFHGLPFNMGTMGGFPGFGLPSFAAPNAPGNSGLYCAPRYSPLFPLLDGCLSP